MKPQKKTETDKEEVKEEKSMEETENALYPFSFLTKCLKNILAIQRQARHHLPLSAFVNFSCHCKDNFIGNSTGLSWENVWKMNFFSGSGESQGILCKVREI